MLHDFLGERLHNIFAWRGCMIFLTHLLTQVAWFFVEIAWCFFVERLHDFLLRGCVIFVERLYDFFCEVFFFLVERLRDYVCGEVVWFLCVKRLCDFLTHSLTRSGCMISFCGGCMIFFPGGNVWFFSLLTTGY